MTNFYGCHCHYLENLSVQLCLVQTLGTWPFCLQTCHYTCARALAFEYNSQHLLFQYYHASSINCFQPENHDQIHKELMTIHISCASNGSLWCSFWPKYLRPRNGFCKRYCVHVYWQHSCVFLQTGFELLTSPARLFDPIPSSIGKEPHTLILSKFSIWIIHYIL